MNELMNERKRENWSMRVEKRDEVDVRVGFFIGRDWVS